MIWASYEPVDVGPGPPQSRAAAKREFDLAMQQKAKRIGQIRGLLAANAVDPGSADRDVQAVNDWYRAEVEPDPMQPGQLTPRWYSVSADLGYFLGDLMIERHPQLRWELFVWGKKNVAYHRPVIMGFTQVAYPKYAVNPVSLVVTYGHRVVAGQGSVMAYGTVNVRGRAVDVDAIAARTPRREPEPDYFVSWLHAIDQRA
jgi:hypothetical protein